MAMDMSPISAAVAQLDPLTLADFKSLTAWGRMTPMSPVIQAQVQYDHEQQFDRVHLEKPWQQQGQQQQQGRLDSPVGLIAAPNSLSYSHSLSTPPPPLPSADHGSVPPVGAWVLSSLKDPNGVQWSPDVDADTSPSFGPSLPRAASADRAAHGRAADGGGGKGGASEGALRALV